MFYAIKNVDDLENSKYLASLQNQVKVVRLQDKLGKQNFHEDMKKSMNLLLNHVKTPLKL